MYSNQTPSPYGNRRHQDVANRGPAAPPLRLIDPPKPLGSMAVAAAPGRTLPPPFQRPVDQTEAAHHRLDRTGRQLSSSQRGHYNTQQLPSTQSQATSSSRTPYQYQPAIHPTPRLTSLPYDSPSAYPRGDLDDTGLRPANEYSAYDVPTQSTYGGENVNSLRKAPRIGPDHASLRNSLASERSSISFLNARESTSYQYTQPTVAVNSLQHGTQDM